MKNLFIILPLIVSCTHLRSPASEPPSWIEGVRSGEESMKVINGSKILYRRILPLHDESPQSTCSKVLELASQDIANEFVLETKIPYTLELLYFDEKHRDCAVTLSISAQMSSRLAEISEIKKSHKRIESELEKKWDEARSEKAQIEARNKELETFILKNQHLLNQYNRSVSDINKAWAMLKNRKEIALTSAFTGLNKREFQQLVNHDFGINFRFNTICRKYYDVPNVSYHGAVAVCWSSSSEREATIVGYCESESGSCFSRKP